MPGRVSAQGGVCLRWVSAWGCLNRGVFAQEECLPGGVCHPHCGQEELHMPVKHYLSATTVVGGNNPG